MKSKWTIPVAIVVGGLLIASAVYVSMRKSGVQSAGQLSVLRPIDTSDHMLGDPSAPAVIVEYADLADPYSKEFHSVLHQIVANEGAGGKVAWVFRHFPLDDSSASLSLAFSKAAECAGEVSGNDGFWRFIDTLYASGSITSTDLGSVASKAGISSGDVFATCYASESASAPLIAHIKTDRQNAIDAGIGSVPYSIIYVKGKSPVVIDGTYDYDTVKNLLDRVLAQ